MFGWYYKCITLNMSKYFLVRNFSTNYLCNAKSLGTEFGLNKAERRHLKKRIVNAYSSVEANHIYKTSSKIGNKYELTKYLIQNEVYNDEGIIAFNKPFGIRRFKVEENNLPHTILHSLNNPGFVGEVSIEETLPLLKQHYNEPDLQVVFSAERWSSGIIVCSLSSATAEKIQKCFRRSKGLQKPHISYWAVVQGLTTPETVAERVGITNHYVENVGNVPIIKKQFSKLEVRKHLVKPNVVEHVILGHHVENDVSLVEVKLLHSSMHFLRVWLAYCYSPVFGDRLFGGRINTILGKKYLVQPKHFSSYKPPDVSTKILKKLNLSTSQIELISPHIHLSSMCLESFLKKDENIMITAPPPDHFLWTCRRLSLMVEEEVVSTSA